MAFGPKRKMALLADSSRDNAYFRIIAWGRSMTFERRKTSGLCSLTEQHSHSRQSSSILNRTPFVLVSRRRPAISHTASSAVVEIKNKVGR